jgi:hypothetical protein
VLFYLLLGVVVYARDKYSIDIYIVYAVFILHVLRFAMWLCH